MIMRRTVCVRERGVVDVVARPVEIAERRGVDAA
jgi:hypothetical protein